MAPITVAVADAHRLFADGMARSLQNHAGLDVSQQTSTTGRDLVKEVARRSPDVVLIDFWITDMPGPGAARAILKMSPSTKVLFLTGFFIGPTQNRQALELGALCFLKKDLPLHEVVVAIRAAAAVGGSGATARGERRSDRSGPLVVLTGREIEVLQVLRSGLPHSEVADRLSISTGTLRNHIRSILLKTRTHTLVDAMLMAEKERFISSPWE